jgi:hypothetical protein
MKIATQALNLLSNNLLFLIVSGLIDENLEKTRSVAVPRSTGEDVQSSVMVALMNEIPEQPNDLLSCSPSPSKTRKHPTKPANLRTISNKRTENYDYHTKKTFSTQSTLPTEPKKLEPTMACCRV